MRTVVRRRNGPRNRHASTVDRSVLNNTPSMSYWNATGFDYRDGDSSHVMSVYSVKTLDLCMGSQSAANRCS